MTYCPTLMQQIGILRISTQSYSECFQSADSLFKNFLTEHPGMTLDDISGIHTFWNEHLITEMCMERTGGAICAAWLQNQGSLPPKWYTTSFDTKIMTQHGFSQLAALVDHTTICENVHELILLAIQQVDSCTLSPSNTITPRDVFILKILNAFALHPEKMSAVCKIVQQKGISPQDSFNLNQASAASLFGIASESTDYTPYTMQQFAESMMKPHIYAFWEQLCLEQHLEQSRTSNHNMHHKKRL